MSLLNRVESLGERAEQRWMKSRQPKRAYWCTYTILFCLLFSVILAGFLFLGKSFVFEGRMGDGLRQHYVSLAYYGEYLREFFYNLFVKHTFEIPMWDIHIGYGSDILSTLHYYAIGDPLNLLAVFVPAEYTEYLYCFLLVLRMYLAGVSFSMYCLYHKNGRFPTLLGAILFVFCQWILVAGFKHPFFINPFIYYPLLLLGIDKIFKKEKPYLFIITVAVSAMSNFYYFYMLGIFMVIYAVYRYFMIFKKVKVGEVFQWLGKFAGFSVTGILMSAVIFLPSILALLGTDRVGAENYIPQAYRIKYYHMLIPALFGKFQSRYTLIGISAVGVAGLLILFVKRKKNIQLKIGFLMCLGFLLVPFVGHVFNGFSYVTNRWCWALIMLMCYIFVKMYPDLFTLTRNQRIVIMSVLAIMAVYIFVDTYANDIWNICAVILLLVVFGLVLLKYDYFREHKSVTSCLILAGIIAGTVMNFYFCFTSAGNDESGVWKFSDIGTAYEKNTGPVTEALGQQKDSSEYRYEQGGSGILQNSPMLTGLYGSQFFFSLANGNVSSFMDEMYSNKPLEQNFQDVNGRAFLMKLLSMKYFAGNELYVPYGFEKITEISVDEDEIDETDIKVESDTDEDSETDSYSETESADAANTKKIVGIYEDKNALPLAYTYGSYISRETYESMGVLERQQAVLQGVVLEDSDLPVCEPEDTSVEQPFTIVPLENCELFDNRIKAKEDGATCILEFQGIPASEVYVMFDNLQYLEVNRRHKYSDEEWSALSFGERRKISIRDESVENQVAITMEAVLDGKDVKKSLQTVTSKNNFYNGRHNFINNMGYAESAVTQIKLTFEQKGSYRYDDLSVCFQPTDRLNEYTDALKSDTVENLKIDGDDVSCSVELDKAKALVFSLPYSDGWTAVVDGQEAELKQANTMFMAVELEPGRHNIELHYTTPYIRLGVVLSLAGVCIFAAIIVIEARSRKKK